MGLLLMYSMKDSVTSTEICSNNEHKAVVKITFVVKVHLLCVFCVCARTDILNVIKAQGSSFPSVLQRLSGKSFIMSMKETDSKERLCFYFLMKNFKIYK